MRPFRLARIAAEAERVRLRALLNRLVTRLILAGIALVCILGALVFGHIAAWYYLRVGFGLSFLVTAAILGGADLLVAIIFGSLASRSSPGRVEREAMEVRRKAVAGIGGAVSLANLTLPVLRIFTDLRRRRRV